jgi:hypothetical protein
LDCGYRLDLLVEQSVVVEIKSLSSIEPIHEAQLLTCLKLGGSNGKSLRFARRAGIKGRHTSENSMSFSPLCVLCKRRGEQCPHIPFRLAEPGDPCGAAAALGLTRLRVSAEIPGSGPGQALGGAGETFPRSFPLLQS